MKNKEAKFPFLIIKNEIDGTEHKYISRVYLLNAFMGLKILLAQKDYDGLEKELDKSLNEINRRVVQ